MSLTDLLAVTAIGMFVANLMVAIRAVLQGNKAATPEPRIEAINHVREALHDLIQDGVVKTNTPDSLYKALHVSTPVFSGKVREHIDQAYAMACRLQHIGWQITDQDAHDIVALRRDLQTLIAYMNEEAALVGYADPPGLRPWRWLQTAGYGI